MDLESCRSKPHVLDDYIHEGLNVIENWNSANADLRALSPLKWQHINPYGTFALNMKERLPLELVTAYLGATLRDFRPSLG
jgi:hypothetical protein